MSEVIVIAFFAVIGALLLKLFKNSDSGQHKNNSHRKDEDLQEKPFHRHNKDYTLRKKYAAVTIAHEQDACDSVKSLGNVRFLIRNAPLLPVRGCTKSKSCECQYLHHTDRRKIDRRTGLQSQTSKDDNRQLKRRDEDQYNVA